MYQCCQRATWKRKRRRNKIGKTRKVPALTVPRASMLRLRRDDARTVQQITQRLNGLQDAALFRFAFLLSSRDRVLRTLTLGGQHCGHSVTRGAGGGSRFKRPGGLTLFMSSSPAAKRARLARADYRIHCFHFSPAPRERGFLSFWFVSSSEWFVPLDTLSTNHGSSPTRA